MDKTYQSVNPRMSLYLRSPAKPGPKTVASLAQQWAKKYLENLNSDVSKEEVSELETATALTENRVEVAEKLQHCLRGACAQAWSKTELLLGEEVKRHQIKLDAINPWQIAASAYQIYEQTLQFYAQGETPQRLSVLLGPAIGSIRKSYKSPDPRVLGFVNLQFHHTGSFLLQELPEIERRLLSYYFQVIDDHLNMPLQRAYEAAALQPDNSLALAAVRKLLPVSGEIAKNVCKRVCKIYPNYRSYSGKLTDLRVNFSSLRDVEMFQVYLWVCVLEQNLSSVQSELFPLCVLLYPNLGVSWELVRQMLFLMTQEMAAHLPFEQYDLFVPYIEVLWEMFSPEVFAKYEDRNLSIESIQNWIAT